MEAVIYFVNGSNPRWPKGWIILAPYTDCPTPKGCDREGADTLAKVDKLEQRLRDQELGERAADKIHDEKVFGPLRDAIRERLYARMISKSTPQFEKDFIGAYLSHRIERRHKFHAKFDEYQCYLTARHMDTPKGRRVDREESNIERIG